MSSDCEKRATLLCSLPSVKDHAKGPCYAHGRADYMLCKLHNMSMYIRDVVIHDVWDIFMEFTTYAAQNSIPRERRDAIRGAAPPS